MELPQGVFKTATHSKEAFARAVLYQPKKVLLIDTGLDSPVHGRLTDVLKHKNPITVTNWDESWTMVVTQYKTGRIGVE